MFYNKKDVLCTSFCAMIGATSKKEGFAMKKKILLMEFKHETNVFNPAPADEAAFTNHRMLAGQESLEFHRTIGSEYNGFLKILEQRGDVELIPTVSLNANPSGPVTASVYNFVQDTVLDAIRAHSPLTAVLISFHGAMVAEGHRDGEGDLLEQIRELVGWEIPIICSMDLHANVTEKMARCANALVPFECYPHIDDHETGLAAAELMDETLNGTLQPVMAFRKIPYLLPMFPTDEPEMKALYAKTKELQSREGVRLVRFAHGFFQADMEELGMSVMAITNGDRVLAEQIADEMEAAILAAKPGLKRHYPTLDEALDRAILPGDGPVILADASDNPGAGGLGDSTHVLRRILERGITGCAMALLVDPESVAVCEKAGVGAEVELDLAGKSDPAYSGGPLHVKAYVKMLSDGKYRNKGLVARGTIMKLGKTAVVEIAGNLVIVSSVPKQPYDIEIFRAHGITPEDQKILVVKSTVHYRASYGPIAREMIAVALPGYAVPVPEGFAYKHWKGEV